MRCRIRGAAAAVAAVLLLPGCAAATSAGAAPTRTPYAGSLVTALTATQAEEPWMHPGAAGEVVECSTPPSGGSRLSPNTEGAVGADPQGAIETATGEGLFLDLPNGDLTQERDDGDRVLFTTVHDGRALQAAVVRFGPSGPGTGADGDGKGWYVESWATCDLPDFPESVSAARGVEIWSDAQGRRQPTSVIVSSSGPAHCGWQDMTFLSLDGGDLGGKGETWVARPQADLEEYFDAAYREQVAVPADAVDTGFSRGDDRLWIAADRAVAYVGTEDDAAAWPRTVRPLACA